MKTSIERAKAREEKLKDLIVPVFVRIRLLALLEAGLVAEDRLRDRAYLARQVVDDTLHDLAPSRMFVQTEGTFRRGAQLLGKRGDKEGAIILLFTAVEHVTNFYIRMFGEMRKHDASTISEMISASHPLKMAVVLPGLGFQIPQRIKMRIAELRAIRNRIVHFDHVPFILHPTNEKLGSLDKLRKALEGILLRRYYTVPSSFRDYCEKLYQKQHPQYASMLIAAETLNCLR